jgi:membrane-bound lytic murein transglycosylase A
MIKTTLSLIIIILFLACSKEEVIIFSSMPKTRLILDNINANKLLDDKELAQIFKHFQSNCQYSRVKNIYGDLCEKSFHVKSPKDFFLHYFKRYKILKDKEEDHALLTGYFEPLLRGSRIKSKPYLYPLYNPPSNLLHVRLGDAYKELKTMRLRGKLIDGEIIAFDDRESINTKDNNLSAICYVDDRIARFFLEVQGSGRVQLDSGETIFVGYADQNGHAYTSIGKVLIEKKALSKEEVSLQSIRKWLEEHPESLNDILHLNRSFVFFKERSYSATGALGIELTPMQSVAVDPSFIPLGSLLSLESDSYTQIVFAEDTGGAIRGSVRADLFLGFGEKALKKAGSLKEELVLYMWLPKNYKGKIQK